MAEYTLVFRRAVAGDGHSQLDARPWMVTHPALGLGDPFAPRNGPPAHGRAMAQMFAVPICSALGMDSAAYERFLAESGALQAALAVLGNTSLTRTATAVTARKEIQALVMAAEVQHIIGRLSA